MLIASPAHLKRIPEALDWSGVRGHLRAVFSSGGALPAVAASAAQAATSRVRSTAAASASPCCSRTYRARPAGVSLGIGSKPRSPGVK